MKECKYSKMPPCYRDGYGVWHHSDDTHDKVYALNKQMCDLERGLSNDFLDMQVRIADKLAKDVVEGVRTPDWAKNMLAGIPEQLSCAEYEILEEILKEKNRFMEEKKTKKMTKAEAFEWLKCKKINCRDASSCQVQAKLFEIDMCWITGDKNICVTQFLLIDADGCISHCGYDEEYFDKLLYTQVSADDILSIEIVEEEKEPLDKWEEFASKVAKIQETLEDDEVCIITKTNFLTMTK